MASTPHTYIMVNEGEDRLVSFVERSVASNTVAQTEVAVTLPYVPTYRMVAGPVRLATASSHIFQFMGSGLNRTLLRYVEITQVGNAASAQRLEVELRRLDTRGTGGTAVTPNANDPSIDTASTATGMTLPTAKGTEDELLAKKAGSILTTAAAAGHERVVRFTFPETGDPTTKPLVFAAGSTTGFAIKNVQSDTTATVLIELEYQEVFWS